MEALYAEINALRSTRKKAYSRVDAIKRQIAIANRTASLYTASGQKRNRDTDAKRSQRGSVDETADQAARPQEPDEEQPAKKPKLSSFVARVVPEAEATDAAPDNVVIDDAGPPEDDAAAATAQTGPTTTTVVDDGDAPRSSATGATSGNGGRRLSRQADAARSKRMFGALLGHLNKAKENLTEEQEAERQRRKASIEQHVQERIQTESVQLREEQMKQLQEDLENEQAAMKDVMDKLFDKETKVKALRMIIRHVRMSGLIQTKATPPVMWKPGQHTSQTKKLMLRSRKETKKGLREAVGKLVRLCFASCSAATL
ncbi:hypothetical protein PBRA_008173 [Plasmodiophora brassicae]|uniref:Pinin/SDK/MemA protein domain-containing protein n=1 Tax=Plasmodiophora brassicae TaxID=37360 RepID=A0A0G4J0N1_PLABS|nr:hypothetical protein PBRA_008173 [Plasmodiophora brassicae]